MMIFKSYADAESYLGSRNKRRFPVGSPRATHIMRRAADRIAVRYHDTDVVTYTPDYIELDTGGWRSVTTKARMNACAPAYISSTRGVWFCGRTPFRDHMRLDYTGNIISGAGTQADVEAMNKLRVKINTYAKTFIAKLYAGEIDLPSKKDCVLCLAISKDHNHLLNHIEEEYYVPALLVSAVAVHGSMSDRMVIFGLMGKAAVPGWSKRASNTHKLEKHLIDFLSKRLVVAP